MRSLRAAAAVAAGVVLAGLTHASAVSTGPVLVATSPHVYDLLGGDAGAGAKISPNGRYVAVIGMPPGTSCTAAVTLCPSQRAVAVYDLVKRRTHVLATGLNGADVYGVADNGSVAYRAFKDWNVGNQHLVTTWSGKTISLAALLPRPYIMGDWADPYGNVLSADGQSVEVFANGPGSQPLMLSLKTHKLWMPALYHHRMFLGIDGMPSGDGRRMIFTNATDDKALPHGKGHENDVYVRDASRNSVKLITGGIAPGQQLVINSLSFDYFGRYAAVSYWQRQEAPVHGFYTNAEGYERLISVIDTRTAKVVITLPTLTGDATTTKEADEGWISGDGRYLLYRSFLDPADRSGGKYGIFKLDLQNRTATQVNPLPSTSCTTGCASTDIGAPSSDLHASTIAFVDSAQLSSSDTDSYNDAYVVRGG